jgi:hypothetical protein
VHRDLDRKPSLEAGWNTLRLEDVTEHLWSEQASKTLRHHGASRVPDSWDGQRCDQGQVGPAGWVIVAGQKDQASQLTIPRRRERERNKRTPRVTDDNGPLDIEALQHAVQEMRLR